MPPHKRGGGRGGRGGDRGKGPGRGGPGRGGRGRGGNRPPMQNCKFRRFVYNCTSIIIAESTLLSIVMVAFKHKPLFQSDIIFVHIAY